jgi:hypothetical protein
MLKRREDSGSPKEANGNLVVREWKWSWRTIRVQWRNLTLKNNNIRKEMISISMKLTSRSQKVVM